MHSFLACTLLVSRSQSGQPLSGPCSGARSTDRPNRLVGFPSAADDVHGCGLDGDDEPRDWAVMFSVVIYTPRLGFSPTYFVSSGRSMGSQHHEHKG